MTEFLPKEPKTKLGRFLQGLKNELWFKRLCQDCKTVKTSDTDDHDKPLCEKCANERALYKAMLQSPAVMKCPKCHEHMQLGIITDAKNAVFHKCTTEGCHTMVLDQRTLKGITILQLDWYPETLAPPEEEQSEKKFVAFSTN